MSNRSLERYAATRLRLAGEKIANSTNMCFVVWDDYASESENAAPVSFAHYDYLGLSDHPQVIGAAVDAAKSYGPTASASRFVGGERKIHRELERQLAGFFQSDDALCLVSGYLTNVTLIAHVVGRRDLIVIDEFAHNSLFAGARQSGAEIVRFRHNDMTDLDEKLSRHQGRHGKVLIVVESLYSMDGDILDLPLALEIKQRYDAWMLLDEAHSFGVLGGTGRGLTEHFTCDANQIEFRTGTLSKALVSAGGFILAAENVIRWLRYTLPGFVYSVGLPPSAAAASLAALSLLGREPERVRRLQELSTHFLKVAKKMGFNTGTAAGAGIVPVVFDRNEDVVRISEDYFSRGFYVPPVARIGVPEECPRLRFFLSEHHTQAVVDKSLTTLGEIVGALELSR